MNEIRVRVAEYAVAAGDVVLSTIGLGSCVAIALYDPTARVGGLAHVLLPDRSLSRHGDSAGKFPETAVPRLVEEMRSLGSCGPLGARIAGGASMFASLLGGGGINMGERNVAATLDVLRRAGIPVLGNDTGGDHGRSVYLRVASGELLVRSLRKGDRVL